MTKFGTTVDIMNAYATKEHEHLDLRDSCCVGISSSLANGFMEKEMSKILVRRPLFLSSLGRPPGLYVSLAQDEEFVTKMFPESICLFLS